MIEVYYRDKKIVFTDKAPQNTLASACCEWHSMVRIEMLLEMIQHNDIIYVICNSTNSCFADFEAKFDPITAAGGIVRNSKGDILMIYRNGYWDLPKGKLEDNETIEQCAIREVEEECGVKHLEIRELIRSTQHFYNIYGTWQLKTTFWYSMTTQWDGHLVAQQEEGIDEVRWIKPDQIEEYTKGCYSTITEILKLTLNK